MQFIKGIIGYTISGFILFSCTHKTTKHIESIIDILEGQQELNNKSFIIDDFLSSEVTKLRNEIIILKNELNLTNKKLNNLEENLGPDYWELDEICSDEQ